MLIAYLSMSLTGCSGSTTGTDSGSSQPTCDRAERSCDPDVRTRIVDGCGDTVKDCKGNNVCKQGRCECKAGFASTQDGACEDCSGTYTLCEDGNVAAYDGCDERLPESNIQCETDETCRSGACVACGSDTTRRCIDDQVVEEDLCGGQTLLFDCPCDLASQCNLQECGHTTTHADVCYHASPNNGHIAEGWWVVEDNGCPSQGYPLGFDTVEFCGDGGCECPSPGHCVCY